MATGIGNTRPPGPPPAQHFYVPATSMQRVWTLGEISQLTGVPVARLQQLNPQITYPNAVQPGMSVRYA